MAFRKLVGSYKDYNLSTHIIEDGYLAVDVDTGSLRIGDGVTPGGTAVAGGGGRSSAAPSHLPAAWRPAGLCSCCPKPEGSVGRRCGCCGARPSTRSRPAPSPRTWAGGTRRATAACGRRSSSTRSRCTTGTSCPGTRRSRAAACSTGCSRRTASCAHRCRVLSR